MTLEIDLKSVEDVSFSTGARQSFINRNSISIFRIRTFNFYASHELVNLVLAFITLFYYAHCKAFLDIYGKSAV